jgi:hypothetical protein
MKRYWVIGIVVVLLVIIGSVLVYGVSTLNGEMRLRNAIIAKQRDNQSEFDNMWKKVAQVAQVTDAQKNALLDIFKGYALARSAGKEGGSLANWIHESCPTVDTSTFNNLQNLISSSRDRWTMQQKELLDLNREHDNIVTVFPSHLICSAFGRGKIDVTIVTSTRTVAAFASGKDDSVEVFQKK